VALAWLLAILTLAYAWAVTTYKRKLSCLGRTTNSPGTGASQRAGGAARRAPRTGTVVR
jgi:hypothetical protein